MRSALIVLISLLGFAGVPAAAQAPGEQPALSQAAPADAPAAARSLAAQTSSGLPQQSGQARTMRAYWHVFIAFAVVWALLFGYALSVGRRFGKLEEELRRLQ